MKSLLPKAPDKIRDFWVWFSENSSKLAVADVSEGLLAELEVQLFKIHRLDWEIGPGRHAPNFFALSPRGNRELLEFTRCIVAQATKLTGWEFYPAKPPKDWDLVFSLVANGRSVEIDAKFWEFVVYKFKDGTFDLVLKPDNTRGLSDEYLNWAATIIADGEIGEERRMELIESLEVVMSWDEKAMQSARKLEPGLLTKFVR